MLQRTYEITPALPLSQVLQSIAADPDYRKAKSKLLMIFEPVCETEHIRRIAEECRGMLLDAKIIGMTTLGPLSAQTKAPKNTVLSLLLFSEAGLWVKGCHCRNDNQEAVGADFRKELETHPDVKDFFACHPASAFARRRSLMKSAEGMMNILCSAHRQGHRKLRKTIPKYSSMVKFMTAAY